MAVGRKPIPRAMRVIQGTAPAEPRPDEVVPDVAIPEAPDYLTPEQQNVFLERARLLAGMGLMAKEYTDALALYAVEFVSWREACKRISEMGEMVRSPNGYPIQNPFVAIKNRAHEKCMKILAEFGLTASASTKVRKQ